VRQSHSLTGAALALGAIVLVGCSLLLGPPGDTVPVDGSPAVWQLDPDRPPPGPEATSFIAMVTERECASGHDISGPLLPPVIEYGNDAVTVSLYLEPLPAGAQSCQGTLPTPFIIQLTEPLGDRQLVDGMGGTDDDEHL
jgi:hypothetical protein